MMNLFQPSVKLLRKERVGSKLRRVYDAPRTPLERLQAYAGADPKIVAKLIALRDRTDPFDLARTITDKLAAIYEVANRRKESKVG